MNDMQAVTQLDWEKAEGKARKCHLVKSSSALVGSQPRDNVQSCCIKNS